MREVCSHKKSCLMTASNGNFGNPCTGNKQLTVKYYCERKLHDCLANCNPEIINLSQQLLCIRPKSYFVTPNSSGKSPCPTTSFQCGSGQCIDHSNVCDGRIDCFDKSDENSTNCGESKLATVVSMVSLLHT